MRNWTRTPRLNVTIHSDSKYAVSCMNVWIDKWTQNGWTNAQGEPVANRDLIEQASNLDDRLAYDTSTLSSNVI